MNQKAGKKEIDNTGTTCPYCQEYAKPHDWIRLESELAEAQEVATNNYALLSKTRAENAELISALRALVNAEAEYGDPKNVAVNEAWQPATVLLQKLGKLT